jgi:hypothetical protein
MARSSTGTHKIGHSKALHTVVFVIAMISFTLNDSNARAANVIPFDYRLAAAADKFDDTRQFAVAFKMRPRRRLRAKCLELAMGTISTSQEIRRFVSLGPVWRLPINSRSLPLASGPEITEEASG